MPVRLVRRGAGLSPIQLLHKPPDVMVGEVLARLEKEGVRDNTIVLFMTDHGISHARGKQFMYDEGLHVPLVIAGPGITAGTVRDDLVEHIDIAALSLAAAGIAIPKTMQARDILAKDYKPRVAVFAARDRCDETVDHIRSVRTKDFKYIRNFLPNRPYLQPCAYKDAKAILKALREYHAAGKLNETQELLFREVRPREEFYDVHADKLWGYPRPRKRSREVLDVLKRMRRRYPAEQRIHLILDNFSPHGKDELRRWCRENNVHLIWTPTNASWLNPIECQFTGVKKFVIQNSYYGDHKELADALRRYAIYRNRHAKKKR